ncbi:Ig-like domain-containing protein [Clostridium sp. PL3]|uniref:Ig-like domain-containing protein n=1 Tax=Clostridium thailandense TaxID=2794346 RepID=A0A949TWQ5_9CLOT|nr:Ig-like domain-containing protein [Clostridium thailandense]MBV7273908.1 Ig-like domain-containing protein [Clostridium thailandense]
MNKSKKPLAVLSTAAVAGLIAAAVTTPVSAKTTALAVNGNDTKSYEYNFTALKTSAASYVLNGASDPGAALYNDFLSRKVSMKGYYDDVKAAYVDASVVNTAAATAYAAGLPFTLNTFTEDTTTPTVALTPDKVSVDSTGKVVVTPADPSKTVSSVSAITLTTGLSTVPTLPTTVNVTLGDGTTKAATITWSDAAKAAATYATAGTVTVSGTLADYNNYPVSATVTVNAQLAISSATSINASQVKIVFNRPVTKASAENVANYTVNATAFNLSAVFGGAGSVAKLQDDGVTVILEARVAELANNVSFQLKTTGVTDTGFNTIATSYNTIVGNDTTAPTITSITASAGASGTKNVKVTYSEPVALGTIGAYQIDGQNAVAAIDATDKTVVNLTAAQTLTAGATPTLTVTGLSDGINSSSVINQQFTVTNDTAAPSVVSATQSGSTIKVVFDKEISTTNFADLSEGVSTSDDITLTKQGDGTPYITAAPVLDPSDSTNKTVLFTVLNTVYGSASTANVQFTLKNIQDVNGNAMNAYSKSLTLAKDAVKPNFISGVLDTSDNKTVYLTFDKAVVDPNLTTSGLTIVDKSTATDVTATILAGAAVGDDTITKSDWTAVAGGVTSSNYVKLVLPVALTSGKTYTVTIPANTVADPSGNKNASAITFDVAATSASDTTKPTVAKAASPAITLVGGKNVMHVVYSENVQLADAINPANYVLDGATLPSGTVITNESATSGDTKDFAITLPKDGVTTDVTSASLVVTGVRDIAGNVVNPTTLTKFNTAPLIDLADTKVPTLVSATATGSDKLVLTFSEPVVANTLVNDGVAVTDGTHTATIDLNDSAISTLGNTLTVSTLVNHAAAAQALNTIDFTQPVTITVTAGAVKDAAATPNSIAVIAAADDVAVADKFVDNAAAAVAVTDAGAGIHDASGIKVNITAPTNAATDKIVKYDIYITPVGGTTYTTVADVQANLTKLETFLPSKAGTATALSTADGTKLSDGTTVISTFAGNVETYIIATDDKGNQALVAHEASAAIDITN